MEKEFRGDSMYRNTAVENGKLGMYVPPIKDISSYNTYPYVLKSKHAHRPDVLANELYGNPRLWWVFAHFNQDILIDPIIDFTSGLEIQVPTKFV